MYFLKCNLGATILLVSIYILQGTWMLACIRDDANCAICLHNYKINFFEGWLPASRILANISSFVILCVIKASSMNCPLWRSNTGSDFMILLNFFDLTEKYVTRYWRPIRSAIAVNPSARLTLLYDHRRKSRTKCYGNDVIKCIHLWERSLSRDPK